MKSFTAACIQMRAGRDVAQNAATAAALVSDAAAQGAAFVLTPEMTSLLETKSDDLFAHTRVEEKDEALPVFRALAAEKKIWVLIGSLPVKLAERKLANRSFLISPEGAIAARYDKIHMFDVDLAGGESYRESKNFEAGREAVIADLPWGRLGLSICYDLRFPQLYRALAQAGADFLTVPAAFTRQTGAAHWHTLLKARAIETGCFVFAPAQGGKHECGRETYGHSLVVAPWGEIIAEADHDEPGIVLAEIDPSRIGEARRRVPSLGHDRGFSLPGTVPARQAS
ncbi:Nitrilase/cyanide hydratase and apolipoprotein N-acyltransferase [Parvibaculum lavamentivorans DS-1]|uniref:Nitrilase/cyanide hydratase and apolipoprotein N-acyltransferase n=1 Tax=Parvibaculum lavamentivorans (strain DS-1 / DSM 13023 / NCIMB 13966) TaxID=402881 RepID=A7HTX4_PARL1|nr:carbon-nitrogen hydrolase family protein [Parvibaculum lavamentivorans]ABS63357.1 Nitrilase/cyanide hydratase and apolipoprotein N-acyltransferase [Parvibaculum lavamentivorans DS-1]